jgi:hypothetical protein
VNLYFKEDSLQAFFWEYRSMDNGTFLKVCNLNKGAKCADININSQEIEIKKKVSVRGLWQHKDLGEF